MSSKSILYVAMLLLFVQCASYKKNIMFKTGENMPDQIRAESLQVEKNYTIQKNDLLTLEVSANNGEKLVDPIPEVSPSNAAIQKPEGSKYLVDQNGIVRFPLVGEIKLEGLTLLQAELVLQKEFAKFYTSPYVTLKFTSKRVIVLGAPGGRVLPLSYDNITLVEVLALAEGIDNLGNAENIRVIRKDRVFVIDLTTVEGYRKGNMLIEPGDVVYVEPIRRPFSEGLQANTPLFSLMTMLITVVAILTR